MTYFNAQGQGRVGWRSLVVTQVVNAVDADAQAFISAAGITNLTQASAVNTLVNDLKTYGLWTKMKALYPMVGGTATSHKFNLKDPRDLDAAYRLVFNGGWTHTSTGALPNGTTGYANTFLNALTVNATNHLSYYSRTATVGVEIEMGYYDNSMATFNQLRVASNYIAGANSNTLLFTSTTDARGFWIGSKRTNSDREIYRNNSSETTSLISDIANLPNKIILIGARGENTIPAYYSNKETAFVSIGDGLTDTEATNFYNSVQKFQTTLGRQIGSPIVSDTDAQAFINAAGLTNGTQASAINTLVVDLKAAGLWTKMKALYPFVGGTATTHKWNLKDPRDLDAAFRLVFNGGWTHSSTGAKPNGSNGYANTKFIGSTSLTNNSTHFSKYNRIAESGSGMRAEGVYNFTSYPNQTLISTFYWASGGSVGSQIGDSNSSVAYTPTNGGTGFHLASRTSNVLLKVYRDNSVLGSYTTTNTVSTLPNLPLYIGARNDAGSAEFFNKYEAAFASIGDGLTDAEASTFYTAVQKYQTTLGRQV